MNLHPKKQINTQTWIKIAWIGFALTLIPLLVLAFFSHPQIDDYTFGQVTHQIAQSGGSLWEILQQAAKQVGQVYNQKKLILSLPLWKHTW